MTAPTASRATSTGRFYELALPVTWLGLHPPAPHVRMSGTTAWVPSVTNILGQLAKPALTWWASGEATSWMMSNPDEARTIIASAETVEPVGTQSCKACGRNTDRYLEDKGWWMHTACEPNWKHVRKQFDRNRRAKANLGSLIHGLVELHGHGEEPDPADWSEWTDTETGITFDASGYVAAWRRFVDKHSPEFHMAEATVFNLRHGFAGTLDLIVDVGGKRWLADVKSSARVYRHEGRLQLVAYRHAEGVYVAPGEVVPMPAVDDTAILLLGPDRFVFEPVDTVPDDFERGFLPLVTHHRWAEQRGAE